MDNISQLKKDFLFILEACKEVTEAFSSPDRPEVHLVQRWMEKLCLEDENESESDLRLRNRYMMRLHNCLNEGRLEEPFTELPYLGPLKSLPLGCPNIVRDNTKFFENLEEKAKRATRGLRPPKDPSTFLSTKIFDDNGGACAYLAVSMEEERRRGGGDESVNHRWLTMGTNMPYRKQESDIPDNCVTFNQKSFKNDTPKSSGKRSGTSFSTRSLENENDSTTVVGANSSRSLMQQRPENPANCKEDAYFDSVYAEQLLNAIVSELEGSHPRVHNQQLEDHLIKYRKYISQNPELEVEAQHQDTEQKLRLFLLLHLQAELVRELNPTKYTYRSH